MLAFTKSCSNTANGMQVLLLSLRHFITSVFFFVFVFFQVSISEVPGVVFAKEL